MSQEDGNKTDDVNERFPYTNDLLAGVLVVFLVGLSSWFAYTTGDVPLWLATTGSLAIATAVVWAFGRGAFKSAREFFDGGGE